MLVWLSFVNWLELHWISKRERDENERFSRMLHAADRLEVSLRRAYVILFFFGVIFCLFSIYNKVIKLLFTFLSGAVYKKNLSFFLHAAAAFLPHWGKFNYKTLSFSNTVEFFASFVCLR